MSEVQREITGNIAGKYESGGRGVATVSTGKGDAGGVSYGKHQLASNNGSMAKYLASKFGAPYRAAFGNLQPGTKEFSAVYSKIAADKPLEFATNQFLYIAETHYEPQAAKLKASYIDVTNRHVAVRECVLSVSIQYGPSTSLIIKALGPNFKGTDKEFIEKVQKYRGDSVAIYFKSSSVKVQANVAQRSKDELKDLLALLNT